MPIYTEGILWYLIIIDAVIYNILAWTQGRWHNKVTHWLSDHFPINKLLGIYYLLLVLWLGYTLWRMKLIVFW